MKMLRTIAITHFIENIEAKSDSFLINYRKMQQKRKLKRFLVLQSSLKHKRTIIPKINNFFETIKKYERDVFCSHFGMLRSTFMILQDSLKPFWTRTIRGRLGYSLEKCIYVTLWKLCNSDVTFRELSDRFNIAKGTVHKIFYKTVELICLLKSEIMWPSASQQQNVMESFQNCRQNPFPFVIGCVDGIHFNISMPMQDAANYYNPKGNYTVIMQAICDSKFRFLDVFIGCPGSCHDAHVWEKSPVFKAITSGQVEIAKNALILAGSSYPLSKVLMTPYRDNGHLTSDEKQFNFYLSSTQAFIQQAYGIFKKKFKILKHINLGSVEKASKVIYACTILHNFIINREKPTESNISTDNDNSFIVEEAHLNYAVHMEGNEGSTDGIAARSNLTALFCSKKSQDNFQQFATKYN